MKPLVVANWKANKTIKETVEFAKTFGTSIEQTQVGIVICAPFTSLEILFSLSDEYPFKVGAQNVSRFDDGAFTGEVTAKMLQGVATHCIVGHSERRKYFGETDQSVIEKVDRLLAVGITPILCLSDSQQLENYLNAKGSIATASDKIVFVHEPPSAISGGKDYHPEDPSAASEVIKKIKERIGSSVVVLYGGSINNENIIQFLSQPGVDGFLVGQASLDANGFSTLVGAVSR
jgi:triosephosphate isomerase